MKKFLDPPLASPAGSTDRQAGRASDYCMIWLIIRSFIRSFVMIHSFIHHHYYIMTHHSCKIFSRIFGMNFFLSIYCRHITHIILLSAATSEKDKSAGNLRVTVRKVRLTRVYGTKWQIIWYFWISAKRSLNDSFSWISWKQMLIDWTMKCKWNWKYRSLKLEFNS